jgi:hypothetical protein
MNKEIIKIVVKVLIYALTLLGSYFGVCALSSCSASHQIQGYGKTSIVTNDTTIIYHDGFLKTK